MFHTIGSPYRIQMATTHIQGTWASTGMFLLKANGQILDLKNTIPPVGTGIVKIVPQIQLCWGRQPASLSWLVDSLMSKSFHLVHMEFVCMHVVNWNTIRVTKTQPPNQIKLLPILIIYPKAWFPLPSAFIHLQTTQDGSWDVREHGSLHSPRPRHCTDLSGWWAGRAVSLREVSPMCRWYCTVLQGDQKPKRHSDVANCLSQLRHSS